VKSVNVRLVASVESVSIKWKGTDRMHLSDLLKALDKWCRKLGTRIIFVIDEVQYFRGLYQESLCWRWLMHTII